MLELSTQTTEHSTQAAVRDHTGRFQPGNKLGGRMPKAYETGIVEALKQRYPVEELINRIEEAWQLAKSQKSSRSMIAIIELIAERQFGKPVQTTQSPHGISDALALILSDTTPLLPIEGDEHNIMGSMGS